MKFQSIYQFYKYYLILCIQRILIKEYLIKLVKILNIYI